MSKTVTLNTEALGRITRTSLKNRISEAGSVKNLADELGVSPTTVRSWKWRLRKKAAQI